MKGTENNCNRNLKYVIGSNECAAALFLGVSV